MKKIVLTGGGTLGHVTPHLSLIPHLLEAGYEIHYIGTEKGMEAEKIRSIPQVTYHAALFGCFSAINANLRCLRAARMEHPVHRRRVDAAGRHL